MSVALTIGLFWLFHWMSKTRLRWRQHDEMWRSYRYGLPSDTTNVVQFPMRGKR